MIRKGLAMSCCSLILVAGACGDGGESLRSGSNSPTIASASPGATATQAVPSPSLSPAATQRPRTAADEALAAAVAKYRAIVRKEGEPCAGDNPQKQSCVAALASGSPDRGVAMFSVADAAGMGGFIAIFGRTPAGAWDLWFGTQNISYHAYKLPAPMLVCADGDGVNVRKAPGSDATIATLLKDLTQVQAEEFALTAPSTEAAPQGTGWYRISSPAEGWVHANYVSDAQFKDCALRDGFEKTR